MSGELHFRILNQHWKRLDPLCHKEQYKNLKLGPRKKDIKINNNTSQSVTHAGLPLRANALRSNNDIIIIIVAAAVAHRRLLECELAA